MSSISDLVCSKVKLMHRDPKFDGRIAVVYKVSAFHLHLCFIDGGGGFPTISCRRKNVKVLDKFEPSQARALALHHGVLSTLECFDRPPYRK